MYFWNLLWLKVIPVINYYVVFFLLKGGQGVPDQCHNNNLYPTYQKRPCQLCESLKPTSMGEWSDCILEPVRHDYITNQPELTSSRGKRTRNTTSLDMGYICGTGKRIKVVACSNQGLGIESADKCNGAGNCFLYFYQYL